MLPIMLQCNAEQLLRCSPSVCSASGRKRDPSWVSGKGAKVSTGRAYQRWMEKAPRVIHGPTLSEEHHCCSICPHGHGQHDQQRKWFECRGCTISSVAKDQQLRPNVNLRGGKCSCNHTNLLLTNVFPLHHRGDIIKAWRGQ